MKIISGEKSVNENAKNSPPKLFKTISTIIIAVLVIEYIYSYGCDRKGSANKTEREYVAPEIQEFEYNKNDDIFLSFKFGMSRQQYQNEKRGLIRSGELELWDDENYSFTLFSRHVTINDKYFGSYQGLNQFTAELRFSPIFENDKLVSWKIPLWPLFGGRPNYTVEPANINSVIYHFSNLCGEPKIASNKYTWEKLEVTIESVSKGPYGYETIPVITYKRNK